MMKNVKVKAWLGMVLLATVMGFLLFLPAGTVRYWQGWAFLGVFFWGLVVDYALPDEK
jgi:hypothetical protein